MCFGCYDEARWIVACNGSSQGQVGPSTVLSVPGVLLEDGRESPIGADLPVLLVDMDASASANLRVMEENEDSLVSFSEDDPFALPEVRSLIALAFSWIQQQHVAAGQENPWYTPEVTAAEEDPESLCKKDQNSPSGYGPVDMDQCPSQRSQLRPLFMLRCSRFFRRCQRFPIRCIQGGGGGVAKSLALPLAPPANPSPSLGAPAKAIPSPPKVGSKVSTLAAPQNAQPLDLQELEGDRPNPSYVAQVMIAQSTALTNLVAQLTGSSQDPLSDLQLSVPSGSRRAAGRAKLQSELALHKGVFFDSVVRSMSRRMSPTPSADRGHLDLLVPSEGAGNHSISDHDGDRLFDGRQSWSCKGQHSVDSGDARTSLLWTVGDSSALRY